MASLLSGRELARRESGRTLFANLTLGLDEGDRVGLIGPNGAGKSTLLRVLAGIDKPDAGTLSVRRGLRVGFVPQEESFPDGATVLSVLKSALAKEPIDDAERGMRIEIALAQGNFDSRGKRVDTLSGGWRKRLAIVRALIAEPELVLFDEPTNHLDLAGVEWLEALLDVSNFAFLVVTHDRYFLENVASRLIELNPAYAEGYLSVDGSYSDYLVRKSEYIASQGRRQDALESMARRELAWLRRGARARSTKAKGRIEDAGELMVELETVKRRNAETQSLSDDGFSSSGRRTREMIVGKNLTIARGGRALFSGLDITLSPGTKLGIVGGNGSGKSTLLAILTGELSPDSGTVKTADRLKIVFFEQDRGGIDRNATLRQNLCPNGDMVTFRDSTMHVSGWAKKFGFRDDQLSAKVSAFSGGEQARILIARLMLQSADILILDEPTNDLDLATLQILEDGLESFPGALVIVSHDRFLMDRVATQILALEETGPDYYADYAQYAARRAEKLAAPAPQKPVAKPSTPTSRVGLTAGERRELSQMEETIADAEAKVAEIEVKMASPEIASDAAALNTLWSVDLPAAKANVDELYARWDELETRNQGR